MKNMLQFFSILSRKNTMHFFAGNIPGTFSVLFGCALLGISAYLISVAGLRVGIEMIAVPIVLVRFFGIGRALLRYVERLYTHDTAFKMIKDLRVYLLQFMVHATQLFNTGKNSSDMIRALISDVEKLEEFYLRIVTPLLTAVFVMASVSIFLGLLNPWLLYAYLFFFVLSILFSLFYGAIKGKQYSLDYAEISQNLYRELNRSLLGMLDIVSNSAEEKCLERWQEILKMEEKQSLSYKNLSNVSAKVIGFLSGVTLLYTIIILTILEQHQGFKAEWIASVAIVVFSSFEVLMPLGALSARYSDFQIALNNIFTYTKEGQAQRLKDANRVQVAVTGKEISIQNLSYTYHKQGKQTLEKTIVFPDFILRSGEIKVLRGPSGAGKSTLCNILTGLHDGYKGSVCLDGVEIETMKRELVFQKIAYLRQKPYLYHTSIYNNLKIANPKASETMMIEALNNVGLGDYVEKLTEGLHTLVGEFGTHISGGELRRLAIARELLKDAPIMLLDEPLASLDSKHEALIMELLTNLAKKKNKAILIASHHRIKEEKLDGILYIHASEKIC